MQCDAEMRPNFGDLVASVEWADCQLVASPGAITCTLEAMLEGALIQIAIGRNVLPMPETACGLRLMLADLCKQEKP